MSESIKMTTMQKVKWAILLIVLVALWMIT